MAAYEALSSQKAAVNTSQAVKADSWKTEIIQAQEWKPFRHYN